MDRRLGLGFGLLMAVIALAVPAVAQDEEEQYSALSFVVIRDYNGKPVKNASVIMHPVNKKGKQERAGLQLKTNSEGKTSFSGVPYGPLRIQVLAQGFQTFGEDYAVDKPEMEIVIKLKRPQGQFSIYEQAQETKKKEPNAVEQKPEPKPDAPKPNEQESSAQRPQ